ncbi:hypothetical protein BJV82DRAFT_617496 [Fennellomyces sp. T-0311]|nr:hypothetical protein BJV82DRAFT_617496 [Fennellomyces sp. T-0311]
MNLHIRKVVRCSFRRCRPEGREITHIDCDELDHLLQNLVYKDPIKKVVPRQKKQESVSRKVMPIPALPPVTDETNWKTIGVLPWNGLSFSQYEVSDMGHVRNKLDSQLLKLTCTSDGYACVYMSHDERILEKPMKQVRVARLVANAFVDGYPGAHNVVIHLNGDRQDNRARNLEWVPKNSSLFRKSARPVVASLVEDPKIRKEFSSINKAQHELSAYNLSHSFSKDGNPFTREVNWDGEKKTAVIEMLPSPGK